LVVELPQPVAVQPQFLYWRMGESAASKEIAIEVNDPGLVQVCSATSTSQVFSTALVRDAGQSRCRISVIPNDTSSPAQGAIQLMAVVGGQERVLALYMAVK
jgi:hypothetical protein